MKILVTGAKGFIGRHMCAHLKRKGYEVLPYDIESTEEELVQYCQTCSFVIHLAGINRPMSVEEFYDGNANFTKKLADLLSLYNPTCPIIFSSSIQAALDNDYGRSKKMGEDFLLSSKLPVYVYRLSNVFGKWCRPNYNSACATFCHNIAHDLPIEIRDRAYVVHFNYVDDICENFLKVIEKENYGGSTEILSISPTYDCSLGMLADLLYYFKQEIESDRHLPIVHDEFELKLFKTFCNYLADDRYEYNYAEDDRGYFEELYKSKKWGQISDNVSYPGITKGGHYHTYKKEIFYTVIGQCEIKERNINDNRILFYEVDGKHPQMVDMIPYYTHQIKNVGEGLSHTLMWISEIYDPMTHDTYREPVDKLM